MCTELGVAIGMKGVATVMQEDAAKKRGQATKAADFRSADAAERAADDAVERGKLKDMQVVMRASSVVAAQAVAQSGSGADVNVGAPLATRQATGAVSEVDRRTVAHNATLEAYGLRARAQGFRQHGANAEAEGDAEALGTFLGGIGSMVGMGGKVGADLKTPNADEIRRLEN